MSNSIFDFQVYSPLVWFLIIVILGTAIQLFPPLAYVILAPFVATFIWVIYAAFFGRNLD